MQIYFAPLEGITGFVFRNAYEKYYGGVDKYFTPFITPHTKKNMDMREKRDILPENNKGIYVVPQVLTNKSEELISISKELKEYGYNEINLNIGCPSKTVTAKGKGSGFLEQPKALEKFFDEFFSKADMELSIKTRIGMWELEEAQHLFQIFEKFPFKEIIVHARLGSEFYGGTPHYDVFEEYGTWSNQSLCYNGDIHSLTQMEELDAKWNFCEKYMLGRSLIAQPWMLEYRKKKIEKLHQASSGIATIHEPMKNVDCECLLYNFKEQVAESKNCNIQNLESISDIIDRESLESVKRAETFQQFHDELLEGYAQYLSGDRNVLFRMKELWSYWGTQFVGQEKLLKQIKKATTIKEYQFVVEKLPAICF